MSALAPPAPPAWVSCPKCDARLPCHDPANSRYFGCPTCRTFFHVNPTAAASVARRLDGFRQGLAPGPSVPLGTVGELGGYRCRLTGYQVRGEKDDPLAEWREYQLRPAEPLADGDPADFPLQLAEYQGHWLLIRRAIRYPGIRSGKPFREKSWYDTTHDRTYRLWHRYKPTIRDAVGEFDWNILDDEKLSIQEFTGPPYLLTSEQHPGGTPTWYLAEYLDPAQIATAFNLGVAALPERIGVGAAQPSGVPAWAQLRSLALVTFILLAFAQMLVLGFHQPVQLPQEGFAVAETSPTGKSQMQQSKSFTLPTTSALSLTLTAPSLTNHWVEVTASLVNEQTGRGYEFTRSIEYYEGTEDGEHWTEGSTSASAVLSAVPAGRYHFNLYPTVDAGAGPTELRLDVEENTPLWSNFFLVLGALALVPVVVGWRRNAFEQARWENSNFSS